MRCELCQVLSRSQQKEPAIPMEITSRPWQKLGVDLFLHVSSWYVIVADYYSKYPWIFQLAAISSKDVISALKFSFSEFRGYLPGAAGLVFPKEKTASHENV